MDKPIIFISHITEESDVAASLKNLIEKSFLEMADVFVSSDANSIKMGQKWLDEITQSLSTCAVEIILTSPSSIKRPWINFEAGAGWVRKIPVIPLCHMGLPPSKLPLPLNLLQAATADEVSSLKLVFPVIAEAIGCKMPEIDFSEFINLVKEFDEKAMYWDIVNGALEKLNKINEQIISALKQLKTIKIDLTESQINNYNTFADVLAKHNLLSLERKGDTKITSSGIYYGCNLIPGSNLHKTLSSPKCTH
jgi:hypothetical protein